MLRLVQTIETLPACHLFLLVLLQDVWQSCARRQGWVLPR